MTKKRVFIVCLIVVLFLTALGLYAGYEGPETEQTQQSKANTDGYDVVLDAVANIGYYNITADELELRIEDKSDKGYIIVDVRDQASYDKAHIPGATNIPLKELGYRMYGLDKAKDIIVYCDHGISSAISGEVLAKGGFRDVYDLSSGMDQWHYPIETGNGVVSI